MVYWNLEWSTESRESTEISKGLLKSRRVYWNPEESIESQGSTESRGSTEIPKSLLNLKDLLNLESILKGLLNYEGLVNLESLLKSEGLLNLEVYWDLKVHWNLEGLLKCEGLLKSRGSIEIWKPNVIRRFVTFRRVYCISGVYWNLEFWDLRVYWNPDQRVYRVIELPYEFFPSVITAQFWARCARLSHFPCIFQQKISFFQKRFAPAGAPCLPAKWTFSSPCPN